MSQASPPAGAPHRGPCGSRHQTTFLFSSLGLKPQNRTRGRKRELIKPFRNLFHTKVRLCTKGTLLRNHFKSICGCGDGGLPGAVDAAHFLLSPPRPRAPPQSRHHRLLGHESASSLPLPAGNRIALSSCPHPWVVRGRQRGHTYLAAGIHQGDPHIVHRPPVPLGFPHQVIGGIGVHTSTTPPDLETRHVTPQLL